MRLSLCLLAQAFAHDVRTRRSATHCSSLTSQSDIANNIFIPPYSRTNNIGFCRVDESTNKGILMVKNASGEWGSVCGDNWHGENAEHNANAACSTLGFIGGSFETINQPDWSLNEISFFLDDVACESTEENLLACPRSDKHDCGHTDNVLLSCESVQSISYGLPETIAVYAGDIIDGIYTGGQLFGSATGSRYSITLYNEYVTVITYGYHTHSYWATGSQFGGHLCNFSIHTNRRTYGPWAAHHDKCSSTRTWGLSSYESLYDFLRQNGSVSGYQKVLIRNW